MSSRRQGEGEMVAVWHDQWVIDSLEVPAGMPDALPDALYAFVDERRELSAGTVAWLTAKSDATTVQRLAAAVVDGSLFAPGDEGMGLGRRFIGVMCVVPALRAIGQDSWGFGGDGEPEDFANPMGSWADPIMVYDHEGYTEAFNDALGGVRLLAEALACGSWSTCDVCEGPLDDNEPQCVSGCAQSADDEHQS